MISSVTLSFLFRESSPYQPLRQILLIFLILASWNYFAYRFFFFPTDRAGLYAAGRPLEDADSRTIFVSNVRADLLVLLGFGVCIGFSYFKW